MEGVGMQPHIHLRADQIHPVALVCGCPTRARAIAEMCDNHTELAYNRQYLSFECVYKGTKLLVTSHGVGSAGAVICFEELIHLGVKYIIRAGTAGSLMPSIKQGDLVVVQGAVRDDGPTALHAPPGYPAIADLDMCVTLREQAKKHKDTRVVTGLTLTSDVFYKPAAMPWTVDLYSKFNVECVEMEISALFIVARSRGIKAAAIVCIDGSPLGWRDGDYDPTGNAVSVGKGAMLKISLESAKEIADKHKE
eukprot:GHVN01050435.1.p1 GENE.GHVN01050435.1~~GHVN01050435.1.p1  ORF type:complete len:265 (+),score=38.07 GHVN01050435.1:44-796(+)